MITLCASKLFPSPFSQAGIESFIEQGFVFGDPEEHFHPPGHPHLYRPEYATCPHCTPPVHGECLLLRVEKGKCRQIKASAVVSKARESRGSRNSSQRRTEGTGFFGSLDGRTTEYNLNRKSRRISVANVRMSRMGTETGLITNGV